MMATPDELTIGWQRHVALLFSFTSFAGRRMKIGLAEVAALEQLQVAGELSPGELGVLLAMPSASVTALLDRLEGKKMIVRKPNPRDRRSQLVSLTPVAMQKASLDLLPVAEAMVAKAAEMSEAERVLVATYLETVNQCLLRQQALAPEPRSTPHSSEPNPKFN